MAALDELEKQLVRVERKILDNDPGPAAVACGAALSLALDALFEEIPDSARRELGKRIGWVAKNTDLPKQTNRDLNLLNKIRIRGAHPEKGNPPKLEEVVRAQEILEDFIIEGGLADGMAVERCRRRADSSVAPRPTEDVMKIDRRDQRDKLRDLMECDAHLLVFVAHGEQEQGHALLGDFAFKLALSSLKGQWRTECIRWPGEEISLGADFGTLLQRLGRTIGCHADFTNSGGSGNLVAAEWEHDIARIHERLMKMRSRIFIRHTIGVPIARDEQLLEFYLKRVWEPLAGKLRLGRVLLSFEISHLPCEGVPLLSSSWRQGKRERTTSGRLVQVVQRHTYGDRKHETRVLDELVSVTVDEIREWLTETKKRSPEEAREQARTIHAATRKGKFEPVVKRVQDLFSGEE